MTYLRWSPTVLAVLAAGCFPIFEQDSGPVDELTDDDPMYAELDNGRRVAAVQTASFGVTEVIAAQGVAVPVVHVRLSVTNQHDERPWLVDAVNARLAVPGRAAAAVMFINTDIPTMPLARVERRAPRFIDFYFAYPEGFADPAHPAPLEFRTSITTPRRDFAWYARIGPDAAGDVEHPAVGQAPYWWCDPAYPWPAFNRRGGRKTHRTPTHAVVVRPPHWPSADVTIHNASSLRLAELRLSPLREQAWEPSLISTMEPGAEQAAGPIACARYDVLVVDDRARRCVLPMVHLCFDSGVWSIDDVTLDQCRWAR